LLGQTSGNEVDVAVHAVNAPTRPRRDSFAGFTGGAPQMPIRNEEIFLADR
jgi:hypothetical protein